MSGPLNVAVVMLSWNGRGDTLACLDSLCDITYEPLFVVVVDNGSADGSADAVATAHPNAILVRLDRNHGFAGGTNIGIRTALEHGADAVLMLNNDMVVESGFVEPLAAAASAGAACPQMLFADLPDRIWYAGASFRPTRGHHGRNTHYGEPPLPASAAPYATDCGCAGAMLVPATVLAEVGLLDEELFAYREDLDWSLRARARGRTVLVVPASVVRHKISASTGGEASATSLYYDVRNGLVVAERYAPLGRLGTARRRAEAVFAHLAQGARSGHRSATIRAVLSGWRDARRGKLGQRG